MRRLIIAALAAAEALAFVVGMTAVTVVCGALARDEDEHDCGGMCPAHDVGPDDLGEPRFIVFAAPTLADITNALIDRIVEGETCPDYIDEIQWGAES